MGNRMARYKIKASELRLLVNPLDGVMWKCGPIAEAEIFDAKAAGKTEHRSWEGDGLVNSLTLEQARKFHVNRIATLLDQPIEGQIILILENHVAPIKGYLNDGNHRLAAAYLRGDETICVVVAASAPDKVVNALPSAVLVG